MAEILTDAQLAELERHGHLLLRDVVDGDGVAAMQAAVWQFLGDRGVDPAQPDQWPPKIDRLQTLRKARAFDPFLSSSIVDVISDQLIGAGRWTDLGGSPQALLSLPEPGRWTIPHKVWHMDLPPRGSTESWSAIRFLGFVDRVEPHGGGTLVIEGSHELVRRLVAASPEANVGRATDARKILTRDHAWFTSLSTAGTAPATLLDGATIDGVEVRVCELMGAAGDLLIMHPWLLHNVAMNCSTRPRMMMSYTRYANDAAFFGA